MRLIGLLAAYTGVMLLGAYLVFCGHMFSMIGDAASKAGDSNAWIWNAEGALAMLLGVLAFFAPVVYDIFWEQEREI